MLAEGLMRTILFKLSPQKKSWLRGIWFEQKKKVVEAFLSYGPDQLEQALRSLGIEHGDTVLVHSSFHPLSGFRESSKVLIDTLLRGVGCEGNLLMVSLPYTCSSYQYLQTLKCFDVNKTASRMGLISEIFRRRRNVLRSLHPTHPILAYGPKAEWIVAHHENCLYPCGPGTPFEKLALLNGKVLFFNVSFMYFTFVHYLEHMVREKLSFSLYHEEAFEVPVIDAHGGSRIVRTYVFSREARQRRQFKILETEFLKNGLIKKSRIGNTRLLLVEVEQAIMCTQRMADRGIFFYEAKLTTS